MKRLFLTLLLSIPFVFGCTQSIEILREASAEDIHPADDASIESTEGQLILTSTGTDVMGVTIRHSFDFSNCKSLRFTLKNDSDLSYYFSVSLDEKGVTGRRRTAVKGRIMNMYTLKAGETRTYEMPLPADLKHPQIDDRFSGMRTTPYSRLIGLYSYNADISKIETISFSFRRCNPGTRIIISNLEAVVGERKCADAMLNAPEEEFFPFIDKYGQFKHAHWPGKIHSDKDLMAAKAAEEKDLAQHQGPTEWSRYGGWATGPKLKATGRFRVEKYDGKWWMVDPEGCLFWSHGVVRVTPSTAITPLDGRHIYFEDLPQADDPSAMFYYTHDELLKPYYIARNQKETYDFSSANCYRKYGKDYRTVFAELAHKRLRSWGLNTIANSSDKDIRLMDKTPYIERIEIRSRPIEGSGGEWLPFMDPYDPSFVESVKTQLVSRQNEVRDPWLLGLFVDNEIHWGDICHLARCTIKAQEDQAAKKEFIKILKVKYVNISALNAEWQTSFTSWGDLLVNREDVPSGADADLREFNEMIIHKYYSNIRKTFDEYAPGVLYMGCRFKGGSDGSNQSVLAIGQQYCDVISYNIYCHELRDFPFPDGFDMPVMVGEFHFGSTDRGIFHGSLVEVESQAERGIAYEKYVLSALKHPNFIGTHWHQFSDQAATGRFDGENFQVGFTDCCDTPYYETIKHVRKVGYDMYAIRAGKQ